MVEIRKAYPTDAYKIINIYDVVWKDTFYDILPNGIIHDRLKKINERVMHLRDQIEENNRVIIALDDGKIVGFVFYAKRQDEIYADSEEIRCIYVLPDFQSKGVGTQLLNAAIEEIKKLGYHSFIVDVPSDSRCVSFFKKFGGIKKSISYKKVEGYSVKVDVLWLEVGDSVSKTSDNEWNELYLMLQDRLYLLNNINLEICVLLTDSGNSYMGVGIRNKVCPIETALSNMYMAQDKGIKKILILNKNSKPVLPCGKCRDLLVSLGEDKASMLFDYGSLKTLTIKELNPYYKDIEKV